MLEAHLALARSSRFWEQATIGSESRPEKKRSMLAPAGKNPERRFRASAGPPSPLPLPRHFPGVPPVGREVRGGPLRARPFFLGAQNLFFFCFNCFTISFTISDKNQFGRYARLRPFFLWSVGVLPMRSTSMQWSTVGCRAASRRPLRLLHLSTVDSINRNAKYKAVESCCCRRWFSLLSRNFLCRPWFWKKRVTHEVTGTCGGDSGSTFTTGMHIAQLLGASQESCVAALVHCEHDL